MRAYLAFVKKEFLESVRTYKLLLVIVVFLFFGMLNPITAKITPELLSALMPEGMSITLADPSAADSWTQFYKNMAGMQIIIFIIMFSGMIANEISKSTLVNMLTKGLPRKAVILSKFTAALTIWTLSYCLCFFVTYGYTLYLLPGELPNLFFASFCMWLFGVLLIPVMLFGGVLFANIYGSLLLTGGFAVLLTLLNLIPKLQEWNPIKLSSDNMALLTNDLAAGDFGRSIAVTCVLIAAFLGGTLVLFDNKQI